MNVLNIIFYIVLFTIIYLVVDVNVYRIKVIGLISSIILLLCGNLLWINFDPLKMQMQFEFAYWFSIFKRWFYVFHWGIDGISLFFILLTLLILFISILASWTSVTYKVKEFYITLFFVTFLLLNVFSTQDLLIFYISFESVLIPMFLIIGIWGSRNRKIHAAYQFFIYTLLGSVIMLLGIIYIYVNVGGLTFIRIMDYPYTINEGRLLWLAFFASFMIKVPMVPVHIWLPEAHVEAPTAGSVILAGIILKMGTYGMLRFSLSMFMEATVYYQPLVFLLSIISIIYAACTTIRQTDLKKIIAYSSVVHMNYVTIGIVSCNIYGVEGSIFSMISHGLISSGLFLCIGCLYDRYHTRLLLYYGNLIYTMPVFSILFFLLTLGNISLPGTSSFIGEFFILISIYEHSYTVLICASIGIILGAVYAIWLYNRIIFISNFRKYIFSYSDLNRREFFIIFLLFFLSIVFGIFPNIILENLHVSVLLLLDK